MNCKRVIEIVSTGFDRTEEPEVSKHIDQHLEKCTRCRHELKQLEDTWNLLDQAPSIEVSSGFEARFWAKIKDEEINETSRWTFPRWRITVAYAVGIWCMVILSSFLLTRKDTVSKGKFDTISRFTRIESHNSIKTTYFRRLPKNILKKHTLQRGKQI